MSALALFVASLAAGAVVTVIFAFTSYGWFALAALCVLVAAVAFEKGRW